jgi:hypothetical protein
MAMRNKIALILLFVLVVGVLAACEQAPGEVSGMVKYSDGRPASVTIRFFDSANKQVTEATSSSDGTYYTGKNLSPGTYTVKCFKGEEELKIDKNSATVEADGSFVLNITIS